MSFGTLKKAIIEFVAVGYARLVRMVGLLALFDYLSVVYFSTMISHSLVSSTTECEI